jgi:hypothetical protein
MRLPLILPEVLKSAGRQFGIADGMLDILVAKVKLDGSRVLAGVRQIKARRVRSMWGWTGNSMPAVLAASATT